MHPVFSSVRARSVPSLTWSPGGASTRLSCVLRLDPTVPVAPLIFAPSRQSVRRGNASYASGSVCVEEWESVWTDHNDRFVLAFVLAVRLYRCDMCRFILYFVIFTYDLFLQICVVYLFQIIDVFVNKNNILQFYLLLEIALIGILISTANNENKLANNVKRCDVSTNFKTILFVKVTWLY